MEDKVVKSILKSVFACVCILALASLLPAQTVTPSIAGGTSNFPRFNPPPCDFSDQFYADNGLDSAATAELNAEPDGRFGTFRQTGPPAIGSQVNWVADSNCATNDPTRRNFRILATTGGNADDGNSPFTTGTNETPEFISILAFIHNESAFIGDPNAVTQSRNRVVGAIGPNGGLDNQQTNPGETISIQPGPDVNLGTTTGLNPRGISQQFIVSNFEAYAAVKQTLPNGHFATQPCSLLMIQQFFPNITQVPTDCFPVADTFVNGHTLSDVATPNLRQDWRFATNRNAMDAGPNASDNNCVNVATDPATGVPFCGDTSVGADAGFSDSPFGYFCDDLLGMWILTYFWMTEPPGSPECGPVYRAIGNKNGFNLDGGPIVLTATELNVFLEGHTDALGNPHPCGAEAKEDFTGQDKGAVWLVCPAIPDPRNGGIARDAFLDVVRLSNGNAQDTFVLNAFSCLQQNGKFCNEAAPGQ